MKKTLPHLLLFAVNLFYGAGFTISKMVMPEYIRPMGIILIRVTITTLLFFLLHRFWLGEKVQRKDMALLALCGLFGVVINQELFFLGLNITTPINASLMMIMTPILVTVIAFFLSHEKVTWLKILGILLGGTGAFVIIGGKGFRFTGETALGDLFILINASSFAVYLVMVRPLMKKYHPLTVIKWVFFFGMFPVIVFGWNQFREVEWHRLTWEIWAALAFIVICTTFLAYLFNMLALRELHSSVVGAYIYLQPVLATLISVAVGKDALSGEKIFSAALIFTGVYLVSFAGRDKMPEDELVVQE